uniref:GCP_C_terminal domain-containing protein n=2 Tax=Rhodnius prolixus TaxID=13249 RepID=T1I091_RHOPR
MYSVYLTDNTELIGNIEFVLPSGSMHSGDVIENVQIVSKIKWPLLYLFSPHVMDNYNTIFRFLLRLKKAQVDIHSVWMDVNHYNNIRL